MCLLQQFIFCRILLYSAAFSQFRNARPGAWSLFRVLNTPFHATLLACSWHFHSGLAKWYHKINPGTKTKLKCPTLQLRKQSVKKQRSNYQQLPATTSNYQQLPATTSLSNVATDTYWPAVQVRRQVQYLLISWEFGVIIVFPG